MTGLVRKAMLLSVCGLLFAVAALANVPSATNSTAPQLIKVVGSQAGVADAKGQFTVTVRDLANNVVPNSSVVVDFSNCSDSRVGSIQLFAGLTPDCPTKTVRTLTNGSGVATFRIMGASTGGVGPFSGVGCANIFADGVNLTPTNHVTVVIFDLNGAGVGPADGSVLLGDIFSGSYRARSDFDATTVPNTLGPADFSTFLGISFSNTSINGATLCP